MTQLKLRAGRPDDDNRDYLPESIYHSDIVVNENGNNSQPYPERLQEFTEKIFRDEEDTWFEYVPACYDGTKAVPLVISLHGGLMTGWGQCIYSSWSMVAERDNLIVIYPNAHRRRMWIAEFSPEDAAAKKAAGEPEEIRSELPPDDIADNPDVQLINALIARAEKKYRIDPGRIFIQGMSAGNLMASYYTRYEGARLAGCGESAGPTFDTRLLFHPDGSLCGSRVPVAIWQTRPERNGVPEWLSCTDLELYRYNREYWMKVNGCDPVPEIKIDGEDNFAFYKGTGADLVYLDVKNRDHGQTFDEAFLQWDYLFSGIRRREDGVIEDLGSRIPRKGDDFNIAAAEGTGTVFLNNRLVDFNRPMLRWQKLKYHGQNGGQLVRGDYLMAPVSFLVRTGAAESVVYGEGHLECSLTLKDGRVLSFARGSIGCLIGDDLRSMYCEALDREGELYIPLTWFARMIMGWNASECDGVVYISERYGELSRNMADLIRQLLHRDFWSGLAARA